MRARETVQDFIKKLSKQAEESHYGNKSVSEGAAAALPELVESNSPPETTANNAGVGWPTIQFENQDHSTVGITMEDEADTCPTCKS